MSLVRIEADEMSGKGVIGLDAVPGLEALDMQKKFDELVTDLVVPKFNELSDMLSSNSGAEQVGTAQGISIEDRLENMESGKAQISDVLTKTNEIPYTPSQDYHPATKKYVDTIQLEAAAGDMTKAVYDSDNDGTVDQAQNALQLGGQPFAYFGQSPKRFTATLSTNWSGDEAPFSQTIQLEGVTETDFPHVAPVYSSDLDTALAQKEAWSCVRSAVCGNGTLSFLCDEAKPETAIPVQIEVLR